MQYILWPYLALCWVANHRYRHQGSFIGKLPREEPATRVKSVKVIIENKQAILPGLDQAVRRLIRSSKRRWKWHIEHIQYRSAGSSRWRQICQRSEVSLKTSIIAQQAILIKPNYRSMHQTVRASPGRLFYHCLPLKDDVIDSKQGTAEPIFGNLVLITSYDVLRNRNQLPCQEQAQRRLLNRKNSGINTDR